MLAHDGAHRIRRLIGMVEGNGGAEVVQDMCADDSVEEMFVNVEGSQTEAAVYGCGGAAGKRPGRVGEVGEGWICVLEVCNNDYIISITFDKSVGVIS